MVTIETPKFRSLATVLCEWRNRKLSKSSSGPDKTSLVRLWEVEFENVLCYQIRKCHWTVKADLGAKVDHCMGSNEKCTFISNSVFTDVTISVIISHNITGHGSVERTYQRRSFCISSNKRCYIDSVGQNIMTSCHNRMKGSRGWSWFQISIWHQGPRPLPCTADKSSFVSRWELEPSSYCFIDASK